MLLGKRLKQLRTDKGLTQNDLAKVLGVGRPTVAGYETKGKQPDYEKLVAIANYFEVTTDYLLGKTDNPNTKLLAKEKIPDELKDYNIEYIEVIKEAKENDIPPETIKKMIQFIKETEMNKKKDN